MSVGSTGLALTGATAGTERQYRLAPNRNIQWHLCRRILSDDRSVIGRPVRCRAAHRDTVADETWNHSGIADRPAVDIDQSGQAGSPNGRQGCVSVSHEDLGVQNVCVVTTSCRRSSLTHAFTTFSRSKASEFRLGVAGVRAESR